MILSESQLDNLYAKSLDSILESELGVEYLEESKKKKKSRTISSGPCPECGSLECDGSCSSNTSSECGGNCNEGLDDNEDSINESKNYIKVNGKKYLDISKVNGKDVALDMKDIIEVNGKKYAYELKDNISKNPAKFIGSGVGSVVGSVGGPISSFIGEKIGSKVGSEIDVLRNKMRKKNNKKSILPTNEVYRSKEFTKAMNEYFDITDTETRKILLSINESDQSKVMVALTSKLYNSIINKIDDIDFGEIPNTRGDMSKLSNFNQMIEAIDTMEEILREYKQTTEDTIGVIREAISGVMANSPLWIGAYQKNVELPMATYNTIVLSIITSVTYMISSCIEYIKVPSSDTFTITVNKNALNKTKQHLVFKNLKQFNSSIKSGQMKKAMEYVMKENMDTTNKFVGTLAIGAGAAFAGVIGLLFIVMPIIREGIFMFYHMRVMVSEYFEVQSDFLKINAYNVEANRSDLTKEQKKNITSKQMKVANKFDKFADKIAVQMKNAEVKATVDIRAEDSKKYKANEVLDEKPDSAEADSQSSSSLF